MHRAWFNSSNFKYRYTMRHSQRRMSCWTRINSIVPSKKETTWSSSSRLSRVDHLISSHRTPRTSLSSMGAEPSPQLWVDLLARLTVFQTKAWLGSSGWWSKSGKIRFGSSAFRYQFWSRLQTCTTSNLASPAKLGTYSLKSQWKLQGVCQSRPLLVSRKICCAETTSHKRTHQRSSLTL